MPEVIGIARDFSEIGRRAAQLMVDRLTGALTGPPVTIVLPSRPVLAEAVAADPPALKLVVRREC
jgi:DNA-binding LacI/PurR family transcriptional regulator